MKKVALLYLATLKELFRERALLALTLSVAPFFLLVYRLIFLQGMIVYHIGLVVSPGNTLLYTQNAIKPSNDMELSAYIAEALSEQHYGDNTALFAFRQLDSRTEGEKLLRERSLHLLLVPRYDADSYSVASALHLDVVGDFSDPYYTLALAALQSSLLQIAELPLGFTFEQQSINIAGRKTPFESYVPGLLIVSSLALLFLFSLVTTRERENGIVIRYAMAELPVFALMLGKGAAFITLSAMSAVLAFGAAFILGFEAGPSLLMDLLLCVAFNLGCALSLIGIAFFTASYSHSVYQSFSVAAFPFLLLVFFSGSVYPLPQLPLIHLGKTTVNLFDFLPSTHAVLGIHRILFYSSDLGAAFHRLGILVALSLPYLALGGCSYYLRVIRSSKR